LFQHLLERKYSISFSTTPLRQPTCLAKATTAADRVNVQQEPPEVLMMSSRQQAEVADSETREQGPISRNLQTHLS